MENQIGRKEGRRRGRKDPIKQNQKGKSNVVLGDTQRRRKKFVRKIFFIKYYQRKRPFFPSCNEKKRNFINISFNP